jgi:uncharacterized protein
MPTNNNIAAIKEIYAAFAQGDIQFILDRITENVSWINEGPDSIPYAGTFNGRSEVPRFFTAIASVAERGRVDIEDWITQDDKVVTTGRFRATVKGTGQPLDVAIAHVFTLQNGKISSWLGFSDTARVAEAYTAADRVSVART